MNERVPKPIQNRTKGEEPMKNEPKEKAGTIYLFNGYVIRVDRYNYALAKEVKGKDGKISYDVFGYYSRLLEAFKAFRDRLVRERLQNGRTALVGALTAIQEYDEQIEKFIIDNIPDLK